MNSKKTKLGIGIIVTMLTIVLFLNIEVGNNTKLNDEKSSFGLSKQSTKIKHPQAKPEVVSGMAG